jgi:thiamine biosynthesis lipoprotein
MKQFVVVLFLGLGAARAGDLLRLESTLDAMGAPYSVVAYGSDRGKLEAAVEEAFEEVRRLDRMLSNYRPDSEWSGVNRLASLQPVPVSEELFALIAECIEFSRRSEGAFDISVGPLMKVWGFYKGTGRLPHGAEVRHALGAVGYRHVILDRERRTIRFARTGVELDPGGIGKGYAVDRMVSVLKSAGVAAALVSAGGSSIYALGAPPGEPGWRVTIRNPVDERKTAADVVLRDESMSTSGNYEKFFRAGGRIYSHIMDPRTGRPAEGMFSASIVAPRTFDSEVWAKPVYIRGRGWAAGNIPAGFRAFLCEGTLRTGPRCAWLQ